MAQRAAPTEAVKRIRPEEAIKRLHNEVQEAQKEADAIRRRLEELQPFISAGNTALETYNMQQSQTKPMMDSPGF